MLEFLTTIKEPCPDTIPTLNKTFKEVLSDKSEIELGL